MRKLFRPAFKALSIFLFALLGYLSHADWKVLIYANDQDLDGSRIFDFMRQIAECVRDPNVRVFVQYKLLPPAEFGSTKLLPIRRRLENQVINDFRGTRRFTITHAQGLRERVTIAETLEDFDPNKVSLAEASERSIDMGSRESFEDFVQWGMSHPSEHTMLIIWTHGIGWRRICYDRTGLTPSMIREALERATRNQKIDILRFDSCRTLNIETAYEIASTAHYLIGSAQITPLDVAPLSYKAVLETLSRNPTVNPRKLAESSLEGYQRTFESYRESLRGLEGILEEDSQSWKPSDGYTMSLIDTSKLEELKNAVNLLAWGLMDNAENILPGEITQLRKTLQTYGGSYEELVQRGDVVLVDLLDFVEKVCALPSSQRSQTIVGACELIADAFYNAVIGHIKDGPKVRNSHGLSITFTPVSSFYKEGRRSNETNDAFRAWLELLFLRKEGDPIENPWKHWIGRASWIEEKDPRAKGW